MLQGSITVLLYKLFCNKHLCELQILCEVTVPTWVIGICDCNNANLCIGNWNTIWNSRSL